MLSFLFRGYENCGHGWGGEGGEGRGAVGDVGSIFIADCCCDVVVNGLILFLYYLMMDASY